MEAACLCNDWFMKEVSCRQTLLDRWAGGRAASKLEGLLLGLLCMEWLD